jgi:hypothetical protein
MKFTDIDWYGAPLSGASLLASVDNKGQMEQRTVVRVLTIESLKAKEIEMELTTVYCDEALQMFALPKRQTDFLQARTELGDDP